MSSKLVSSFSHALIVMRSFRFKVLWKSSENENKIDKAYYFGGFRMFRFIDNTDEKSPLIKLLNQILKLDYFCVSSCPRLARMIEDKSTRESVISLGMDSTRHSVMISDILSKLGAKPAEYFEISGGGDNLINIFTEQLAREYEALNKQRGCADLSNDENLRYEFFALAAEQKSRIKVVEKIISNLKQGADKQVLSPSLISSAV
jgi:hypothetical protein